MTTTADTALPVRPGELPTTRPSDVAAVVDRAHDRFAVGVLADTTGWTDAERAPLVDLGFRDDDRGADLWALDLSRAADGTPTRVLDNPALAALDSHHARFAERRGAIVRYRPDVSVCIRIPARATPDDWEDVRVLAGSGAVVRIGPGDVAPAGWLPVESAGGVQLTGESVTGEPDDEAVVLTPDDVPEMTDLVERTKPGPFLPRTIELGTYLGIRRGGRLVAMAGERLHPPGWTEISAVCTDPEHRGQGLGRRLVLAVAHGIRARGEVPLMHAASGNTGAIGLYEHLGFRQRERGALRFVQVP